VSYELPETNLAPVVCCSAWFGVGRCGQCDDRLDRQPAPPRRVPLKVGQLPGQGVALPPAGEERPLGLDHGQARQPDLLR
jgi:hypothetical protein